MSSSDFVDKVDSRDRMRVGTFSGDAPSRALDSLTLLSTPSPRRPVDLSQTHTLAVPRSQMDTPPITPTSPCARAWSNLDGADGDTYTTTSFSMETPTKSRLGTESKPSSAPAECPFDIEFCKDAANEPLTFGKGAWSSVIKAQKRARFPASFLGRYNADYSEPPSPPSTPKAGSIEVFAVKQAMRRDAAPILRNEALILEALSQLTGAQRHIVSFHGVVPQTNSLVLSAIPLTFATFITDKAEVARANFSTLNMFDPVVGTNDWLHFARHLIQGLAWLHDVGQVVHGDIKPQNILLQAVHDGDVGSGRAYMPIYADFSSAHSLNPQAELPDVSSNLAALTTVFTAPELLTSSALAAEGATTTFESDVFSLAVTLVTAASGDVGVYKGQPRQRLLMAQQGHLILDSVDDIRVKRHGRRAPETLVSKVLKDAVLKNPEARVTTTKWLEVLALIETEKETT